MMGKCQSRNVENVPLEIAYNRNDVGWCIVRDFCPIRTNCNQYIRWGKNYSLS